MQGVIDTPQRICRLALTERVRGRIRVEHAGDTMHIEVLDATESGRVRLRFEGSRAFDIQRETLARPALPPSSAGPRCPCGVSTDDH